MKSASEKGLWRAIKARRPELRVTSQGDWQFPKSPVSVVPQFEGYGVDPYIGGAFWLSFDVARDSPKPDGVYHIRVLDANDKTFIIDRNNAMRSRFLPIPDEIAGAFGPQSSMFVQRRRELQTEIEADCPEVDFLFLDWEDVDGWAEWIASRLEVWRERVIEYVDRPRGAS